MAIQCADIETLVHTRLDGELADEDAKGLEAHLTACSACKSRSRDEARFHSRLRAHLAPPSMPASMRERALQQLDREDWRARRTTGARWSWVLPGVASAAAAAALILFVAAGPERETEAPVAYDAVRQHMRRPPLEVQGAAAVPWVKRHLSPVAQIPRFSGPSTRVLGARLSHLRGRDAALVFYERITNSRRYEVSAMILDASDLELGSGRRHVIGGRELWASQSRGFHIVAHKDARGIGYVFTSEMDADALLDFVATSDLLLRANTP